MRRQVGEICSHEARAELTSLLFSENSAALRERNLSSIRYVQLRLLALV